MGFRVGELDQLVTVEREQLTPDGYGGNSLEWVALGQIWAHTRPLNGRENVDYDRVNAEARYLFVVRYPVDIKESDRILWDGEPFNIRVLKKPKTRDLYLQIEAERGVAQ